MRSRTRRRRRTKKEWSLGKGMECRNQVFFRFQRAYQSHIQILRTKEIASNRADLAGSHLSKTAFDFFRPKNSAIGKQLFAEPVHLAVRTFEAEIHLADDVISRAAQLSRRRRFLSQTAQFAQDQPHRLR